MAIGIVGEDLVVGDIPVPRAAETMGELMRRLQQAGIERIVIDRGVQSDEIVRLVETGSSRDRATARRSPVCRTFASAGCRWTSRSRRRRHRDVPQLCRRCGEGGGALWDSAGVEGIPDADAARGWSIRWRRRSRRTGRRCWR